MVRRSTLFSIFAASLLAAGAFAAPGDGKPVQSPKHHPHHIVKKKHKAVKHHHAKKSHKRGAKQGAKKNVVH